MAKRHANGEAVHGGTDHVPKRQKTQPTEHIEEIFSARQLQDLLAFRQDDVERLRNGKHISLVDLSSDRRTDA